MKTLLCETEIDIWNQKLCLNRGPINMLSSLHLHLRSFSSKNEKNRPTNVSWHPLWLHTLESDIIFGFGWGCWCLGPRARDRPHTAPRARCSCTASLGEWVKGRGGTLCFSHRVQWSVQVWQKGHFTHLWVWILFHVKAAVVSAWLCAAGQCDFNSVLLH